MTRLEFAIETAWKAARATLPHFTGGVTVDFKEDDTPVTVADREAEAIIRQEIAARFPGEAVLGEEEGLSGAGDDRWVIDPIDGTKSFISGVPLYATLLSYEQAGEPIVGVAVFPALGWCVSAAKGEGAFREGRRCQVRTETRRDRAVIACGGHKSMVKAGRMEGFLRLVDEALVTRTWGDAYGHALVACGQLDAMVDPVVSRWDISAMSLIVREAGGEFTDFAGCAALAQEAISATPAMAEWVRDAFR